VEGVDTYYRQRYLIFLKFKTKYCSLTCSAEIEVRVRFAVRSQCRTTELCVRSTYPSFPSRILFPGNHCRKLPCESSDPTGTMSSQMENAAMTILDDPMARAFCVSHPEKLNLSLRSSPDNLVSVHLRGSH